MRDKSLMTKILPELFDECLPLHQVLCGLEHIWEQERSCCELAVPRIPSQVPSVPHPCPCISLSHLHNFPFMPLLYNTVSASAFFQGPEKQVLFRQTVLGADLSASSVERCRDSGIQNLSTLGPFRLLLGITFPFYVCYLILPTLQL